MGGVALPRESGTLLIYVRLIYIHIRGGPFSIDWWIVYAYICRVQSSPLGKSHAWQWEQRTTIRINANRDRCCYNKIPTCGNVHIFGSSERAHRENAARVNRIVVAYSETKFHLEMRELGEERDSRKGQARGLGLKVDFPAGSEIMSLRVTWSRIKL